MRLDRSVLPAEISRDPTLISSTPRRTAATVRVRLSCMRFTAAIKWPISLLAVASTRTVRSPPAILSKLSLTARKGRSTTRFMNRKAPRDTARINAAKPRYT
ncbi:hypothetical protein D3C71_1695880 [compost metagenome]